MELLKFKNGFSLVELMVVAGAVAGIGLVVMQLSKNTTSSQVEAFNTADYFGLRSQLDNMFSNDFDCTASFKNLAFKGSTIVANPIDVEIWHGDQTATRTRKFISGTDVAFKKFGKLGITSVQFSMPDFTGASDFPPGNGEVFKAEITIVGDKTKFAKTSAFVPIKRTINITFDTDSTGTSKITDCSSSGSSAASLDKPLSMGGVNYCILAKSCPTGWVDNGTAGIIANYGDGAHAKCAGLFAVGADYNGTWGWCHPHICCNN